MASIFSRIRDAFSDDEGIIQRGRLTLPQRVVSPVPEPRKATQALFTAPSMSNLRGNVAKIKNYVQREYGSPQAAQNLAREFGATLRGEWSPFTQTPKERPAVFKAPIIRNLVDASSGMGESISRGPFNMISGIAGGRPKQAVLGGLRTAATLYGGQALGPGMMALGGGLGALSSGLQGQGFSRGFGSGLGESARIRGFTRVTDPWIFGTSGVAKSLTNNPFAQQIIGRGVTGFGNVIEDEMLSRADSIVPGIGDRLLSFGLGALLTSGGTKQDWDKLKKQITKGLKGEAKNAIEDLVEDARLSTGFRDKKTGRAAAPQFEDWYDTGKQRVDKRSASERIEAGDVKLGGLFEDGRPTLRKQQKTARRNLLSDITGGGVGSLAGFEKDEEGNWRYNPTKGAFGAALGVGASRQMTGRGIKLGLGTEDVSDPLVKKARKYKSAEEFVKAQGTTPLPAKSMMGESGGVPPQGPVKPQLPSGGEKGYKMKTRGVVTTARESEFIDPVVRGQVEGKYRVKPNAQTKARAEQIVAQDFDKAKKMVYEGPLSAESNAVGAELVRKYQSQGQYEDAVDVIHTLSKKATAAGQYNQAFAMWRKLTPEGMLKYVQKEMADANRNMGMVSKTVRKALGKQDAKLTNDDLKQINDLARKAEAATDEATQARYVKKIFELVNKKLPWGVSDILDEYRYNNMLSSPLTHLRNAWSNLQQTYVTRPATLLAQGKGKEAVKYEIAAVKALPEAFDAFKKGLKGEGENLRLELELKKGVKGQMPKRLGNVFNLPTNAMEAGDRFFQTLIKAGEEARGATKEDAAKIAEYSLFRGDLKPEGQGHLLNKIDDITSAMYQLRRVGLGWAIPFLKTPMNVAKQWIEYSPAGLATLPGAGNKKEQLAKVLLGSIAFGLGAMAASEDRVTWAAPIDPEAKRLFYDSGKKPYSIRVGDKWVPLQTLGVFSWALGLPAAAKYYESESREALTDADYEKLGKALLSGVGFWSNQTFVSGLGAFVKLAQGDIDYTLPRNIGSMINQLKPWDALMRYVSQVIDPIYRKPSTLGETLISDVPFLTKTLPTYETTSGEPARRNITNYIAPYGWGYADDTYEEPYRQRIEKLQYNKLRSDFEKEEGVTPKDRAIELIIQGNTQEAREMIEKYQLNKAQGMEITGKNIMEGTLPKQNDIYTGLKEGDLDVMEGADDKDVAFAVYRYVNSLKGEEKRVKGAYLMKNVSEGAQNELRTILALDKKGLSQTDMKVMRVPTKVRAPVIFDVLKDLTPKNRNKRYAQYKALGIITPEVEKELAQLIKGGGKNE